MSGAAIFFVVFLAVVLLAWGSAYRRRKRREFLLGKYNDVSIVDAIMAGQIWQGMSREQLVDSWGSPQARDHKVYKTKTAETYKYSQTGKNRFGNRVMLEDDVVIGWKQNNK